MTTPTYSPTMWRATLIASLIVVATSNATAQTQPRPAVRISRMPTFDHGTWPVDLNRDGRTDLVGGSQLAQGPPRWDVIAAIGRGDGTFATPRSTGVNAAPMGTGDFNRDGRMDVVVSGVAILPGNGDGTFGAPRAVTGSPAPPAMDWMLSRMAANADFDGNGTRDLLLLENAAVTVYPGNGDFTFAPPVQLAATDYGYQQAIVADFNGDGRQDIAATQVFSHVDVFINRGGMLFSMTTIPVPSPFPAPDLWGITAGDLNRDGHRDLLVAATIIGIDEWRAGEIVVMLGNGDGTFRTGVVHHTGVRGAISVVVGDFNADGLLDAATGNQSWRNMGDLPCAATYQYWDSVTIFPGRGDGTFATPATFSLDYTAGDEQSIGSGYRGSHNTLKTSDVNGDRRTDLIASAGAILLNVAPATNRAPTVFAGPDVMVDDEGLARVRATLNDPDHDWVSVVWRDQTGRVVWDAPELCGRWEATTTLTVTVTDARGASASDSVLIFVPSGGPFPFIAVRDPGSGTGVPSGVPYLIRWAATDEDPAINRFTLFRSSNDGRTWAQISECTGLSRTTRECVWRSPGPIGTTHRIRVSAYDSSGALRAFDISERFQVIANQSVPLPSGWARADVGAVSAAGTVSYNGTTFTVRGSGADIWGTTDEFHYLYRQASGDFDFTARVTNVQHLHDMVKAGLMVRTGLSAGAPHMSLFASPIASRGLRFQRRRTLNGTTVHTSGPRVVAPVWLKLARRGTRVYAYSRKSETNFWTLIGSDTVGAMTGTVRVGLAVTSHVDGTLAAGSFDNVTLRSVPAWRCADVGAVGVGGTCSGDHVVSTIEGSGADIGGTADAFRFKYVPWSGDGTIVVRVRSVEPTDSFAKAGVMFRESTAAGSKQVAAVIMPGGGSRMFHRAATGGATTEGQWNGGLPPHWVALTRRGNTFTASASFDGISWYQLGSVTMTMNASALVGLPVTSHDNSTLATAVFDDLALYR